MLADAQEGFKNLTGSDYPYYALVCCSGFLLILFLEKVLVQHGHISENASLLNGKPVLYPYILMIVFSVHSVITGIALGDDTNRYPAWDRVYDVFKRER
jgi:hypothetical protein